MEPALHKVTTPELPTLRDWLEKYLPDSRKMYNTITETIKGAWTGTSFYTLGWPSILAAAEGVVSEDQSPCAGYHTDPRATSIYSPDTDHLEKLLLWPGFFDWSKPIFFQGYSHKLTPTIEKISKSKGGNLKVNENIMLEAMPEDISPLPIPEGYKLHALDPEKDAKYVVSTWTQRRHHTLPFVRELIRKFPSFGLFNSDGECIGVEVTYEFGALGMLHVRPEFRGRGLGKVITTHLAHKNHCAGRPAFVWVIKWNEESIHMHKSAGFKGEGDFDFCVHYLGSWDEHSRLVGHPPYDAWMEDCK